MYGTCVWGLAAHHLSLITFIRSPTSALTSYPEEWYMLMYMCAMLNGSCA